MQLTDTSVCEIVLNLDPVEKDEWMNIKAIGGWFVLHDMATWLFNIPRSRFMCTINKIMGFIEKIVLPDDFRPSKKILNSQKWGEFP